jgi:hypothetical protein
VESFWESFRLDPRQPRNAPMRASDADREVVRTVLAEAYSDGRLTRAEYDDRLNTLYSSSRTLGDVSSLVTDLVPENSTLAPLPVHNADLRTRGARKWRKDVEESLGAFIVPSVICAVIWAAIGGGFFWPMFPMLFLGLNLIKTVVSRESVIEREVLRLEEESRKGVLQNPSADSADQGDDNATP